MKKTRTRIGSILLALALVLTLLPVTAMAADPVEYLDEDGNEQICEEATEVTDKSTAWSAEESTEAWYVVNGNVTIADRITVTGDVHLILANGCKLDAEKGISVTSGNSLTIYGQSGGSGQMIAGTAGIADDYNSGMEFYAGIGGDRGNNGVYAHGTITINGGTITAHGGVAAAGIGGGGGVSYNKETNGTITINGGTVNATGGKDGAGIGGGSQNNVAGGNIIITGGNVTAQGGEDGAGIGGGQLDSQTPGRSVTISGGTVEATGGDRAAGIGSGSSNANRSISSIKINGSADVTATGGVGAAGIGGSYEGKITGAIQIGGSAQVSATGGASDKNDAILAAGAGIGSGGYGGKVGNITISGGTVEAVGGEGEDLGSSSGTSSFSGAGIGSGGSPFTDSESNPIIINAGTITAKAGGDGAAGIGSGAGSSSGAFSTNRKNNTTGETILGKAVIYTDSITDQSGASSDAGDPWSGIIFQGNEGQVYGEAIRLSDTLTLEEGQTLIVPESSKLIVPTGKELIVEEGAKLTVENGGILANNGTLTNNGTMDIEGKLNGQGSFNGVYVAAIDNGKSYFTLDDAVEDATTSGQTVRLLTTEEQDLTKAIAEGVTLVIDKNQTVNITELAAVVNSTGKIRVNATGAIIVNGTKMIGSDGNIQLNTGHIELSVKSDKLALDFVDANATVPSGKYWTLALDAGASTVKMDVTLDSTSTLTVNGTELRVANGSTLTNNGQITVGTLLTVRSEGTLTGSGTITNNGTIALCAADDGSKKAALGTDIKITLNNNGEVLSQFDVEDAKFAGQITETTGTFTVTDGTSKTLTFGYRYVPYVTPETPVTPVIPSTPSVSDDDDDDDDGYSVSVPASSSIRGGSISVSPRSAEKGDTVTITVKPDDGYVLDELTVTARNGGEVDLTRKNSSQYTFKMPAGSVVIEVSFIKEEDAPTAEMSFGDVPESYWAYNEIGWAYDNGYMNGTSATTFNPGGTVTRQQVWMILARMSGADPAGMAAARTWAMDDGISDGTNPGGAVTRQQLVSLLYRFAGQMGYDTNAKADLSSYPDVASLAGYATDAMAWAVANSIVGGTTQGTLNPAGTANRAQFAVILWRFYQTSAN